jgi:hypothetical protein
MCGADSSIVQSITGKFTGNLLESWCFHAPGDCVKRRRNVPAPLARIYYLEESSEEAEMPADPDRARGDEDFLIQKSGSDVD